MRAVVVEFHRLNPNTHVTVDVSDTGTRQAALPADLRAVEGPDVFTVWPGNGNPPPSPRWSTTAYRSP